MAIYTSAEGMRSAHKRYLEWKEAGYPGADPLVPGWCQQMEQLPGLIPAASCEGHLVQHPDGLLWRDFHFIWVTDQKGWDVVGSFRARLLAEMQNYGVPRYWWDHLVVWSNYPGKLYPVTAVAWPAEHLALDCYYHVLRIAPMPAAIGLRFQAAITNVLNQLISKYARP